MKKFLLKLVLIAISTVSAAFAGSYKIVVDAGSSGSRLHLFHYETDAKNLVDIKDIFSENVKPGLSSFKNNPTAAGSSLSPLMEHAALQLQSKRIDPSTVEIDVLATAGMRMLDSDTQAAIYQSVKKTASTFFKPGRIATITGKEEALYGWLDVNYLAKTFQSGSRSIGSIDMGGASTQIAFATHDTQHPDDLVTINVNGTKYIVFAKSFLGLGQDQARDKIASQKDAPACYPTGYSKQGEFNFITCQNLFATLIKNNSVSAQIVALPKQFFYAYSGVYYTYKFLAADQTPYQAALEKKILTICTKSWDQFKQDYPTDKYASLYCANGIYMDSLFYNTYGISKNQLRVVNKINDQDIDWTLGSMLYSTLVK